MVAIIFAFIVLITWGVGDLFTTFATRRMGSFNTSFYVYLIGTIFTALYIPFSLNNLKQFTLPMIELTCFLAILELLAFSAYNEGLTVGNSSLVGTIGGAFTSLVVILSLIFLNEKLITQQIIAIIIIFFGLFLSSINLADLKNKKSLINKGTMYAFISMIGWAISFTFIKIPVQQAGFFWPSFTLLLVGTIIYFLFGFKKIKKPKLSYKSGFPAVFIAGLVLNIGAFSYNIAIAHGLASVVAPIAGAYPALFAFLAYFIFKDPISNQHKLGMIVTLCGIILLAYFSR